MPDSAHPWVHRLASLTGKDLASEKNVRLASYRGAEGPTAFTFWATYCPPCIEEIPMFSELSAAGHRIVGVSMDAVDDEAEVMAVLRKHRAGYPQVLLDAPSMKAAGLALEAGLPFTLVVAADDIVLEEHSGKMTKAAFLAALAAAR